MSRSRQLHIRWLRAELNFAENPVPLARGERTRGWGIREEGVLWNVEIISHLLSFKKMGILFLFLFCLCCVRVCVCVCILMPLGVCVCVFTHVHVLRRLTNLKRPPLLKQLQPIEEARKLLFPGIFLGCQLSSLCRRLHWFLLLQVPCIQCRGYVPGSRQRSDAKLVG